jgi:xanthine dehydrogenase molybdopterin-binding subunit B
MGQGLHTKVAQVAAQELAVPLDSVFIAETSSDKVPNASPTAASAGSDLYGASTLDACRQINDRLKPLRWGAGSLGACMSCMHACLRWHSQIVGAWAPVQTQAPVCM